MNPATSPLLTDLYQLTMAYGYWKLGRADRGACFHLTFRTLPFDGGFAVAAGAGPAVEYLEQLTFEADDLEYLASLAGNDGKPLFERGFLDHLESFRFAGDVDVVPEGSVAFAHEPLVRVRGPMLHCQLAETPLLNLVNFQTLVATKAARVCLAADGGEVIDFGLRRAQGPDGGLSASRAAFIGGTSGTSNVLAGRAFGIPVRGTHAHSWVMSFGPESAEAEAFAAYAGAMPNNVILLADTYDTLQGVRRAAAVGVEMKRRGEAMIGIRLDSGDLAYLSIEARKILDAAGLADAKIVASNDLDEHVISSLRQQRARIDVWGVGTKLVTAYDQPALGGVYKLSAVQAGPYDPAADWSARLKLSEQAAKISFPGVLAARRFYTADGLASADAIYDEAAGVDAAEAIVDPADPTRRKRLPAGETEELLTPALRAGRRVGPVPTLADAHARRAAQLARFHPSVKRLLNPHVYPVGLDHALHESRRRLTLEMKGLATG